MMFADAEHIEAGPVSDFDLFDEVSHAIGRGRKSARDRIGEDGCKTVDADFHGRSLLGCR